MILHSDTTAATALKIEITPESAGWDYTGLVVVRLLSGEIWTDAFPDDEICIVTLWGSAIVESGGASWEVSREGGLFAAKPTALYLPVGSEITMTAGSDCEIAITSSRARVAYPARLITPGEIDVEIRGAGNAARQINHIIKPDFPAHRLLVVEVFTPSGNWSSYPPHKHDISRMPRESKLEEIYYYRIDQPDGFGLQRLYAADDSFDYAWVIQDGDVMLVPEGYHAFVVAHGYTGYYLNILAGDEPVRTMQPADDPRYGWVRGTWSDDLSAGITGWRDIDERVNHGAGSRPE
ncbi:MAG TPA: 5-deoxy-glucuronate isomerase [Thermomicrobiales bacterium]|nr:5-deoxy-glucuronate isomerase [Thermomicrobiales bacterium]